MAAPNKTPEPKIPRALMLGLAGVAVLLALGMGFILARSITRPLQLGLNMMQELAQGRLTSRLKLSTGVTNPLYTGIN